VCLSDDAGQETGRLHGVSNCQLFDLDNAPSDLWHLRAGVPTISFRQLYGFLIMGHGRRQILWFGVTAKLWVNNRHLTAVFDQP
jgi:hypothetical protein